MTAWTIVQLKNQLDADLLTCKDDFERGIVKAIGGREIREKTIEFSKTRKLNPCELAIAEQFGYIIK